MTDLDIDRRTFDRFPVRFQTKYANSPNDFGTEVFLQNASAEGLRIRTREWLREGDPIHLAIKIPDSDRPLQIQGQVVWIRSLQRDFWEAGVRLSRVRLITMQRLFKYSSNFS